MSTPELDQYYRQLHDDYRGAQLKPWEDVETGDMIFRESTQSYRVISRIAPAVEGFRWMYYFPDGSDVERSFQVFDQETAVVMVKP